VVTTPDSYSPNCLIGYWLRDRLAWSVP